MNNELPPGSEVKYFHCKRDAKNRWFVVFTYDDGKECPEPEASLGPVVGVDVGIKTLAACSDGRNYPNPKPLEEESKKLRRLDKAIERSKNQHPEPSNRRERRLRERAILYQNVTNIRKNNHRQTASAIAKTAGTVVVESLNVQGMMQNHKLARALQDTAPGGFLSELKWQCKKRGVRLIEAGRWFPSTQLCARCGELPNERVPLKQRTYRCENCDWTCDRIPMQR